MTTTDSNPNPAAVTNAGDIATTDRLPQTTP